MRNICFICKHKLNRIGKVGKKLIYKCEFCGLGTTKKLKFQQGYYHRDETYIEEEALFKNIFQKRVNIISKYEVRGKVLEVGCSTGIMLSLLKDKGWQVRGVEISETAAKMAEKRGIEIILKPFQSLDTQEKFNLIIFNHTLEHMDNPKKVLAKALSMLNKNGLIYIDLPNFGSLNARLLGTQWPLLLPSEHLWHFTQKALSKLLKDLGFKIVYIEKASGVWDCADPLGGILYSLTHFKKRFFVESLTLVPSWIVSKLGRGSDLMMIAKKI